MPKKKLLYFAENCHKRNKKALREQNVKEMEKKRVKICAFFQLDEPEKICYNNKAVTRTVRDSEIPQDKRSRKEKIKIFEKKA